MVASLHPLICLACRAIPGQSPPPRSPCPRRTAPPPPGIASAASVGAVGGAQASVLTPGARRLLGLPVPCCWGHRGRSCPGGCPPARAEPEPALGKETTAEQASGFSSLTGYSLGGSLRNHRAAPAAAPPPGPASAAGGPGRRRSQPVCEASCFAGRLLPGEACARPCFRGPCLRETGAWTLRALRWTGSWLSLLHEEGPEPTGGLLWAVTATPAGAAGPPVTRRCPHHPGKWWRAWTRPARLLMGTGQVTKAAAPVWGRC